MPGGSIAPHQGLELSLILSGKKDFAVIEKTKDSKQYFAAGAINKPGITVQYTDGAEGPEVIVSRTRKATAEYQALLIDGIERFGLKNYHRAMGVLFGYSKKDIETFIKTEINCNCNKCTGA